MVANEAKQKGETDDPCIERDALQARIAELESNLAAGALVESSLREQLSRSNEDLLASLNDLVALGNLLRNEEQKSSKLATDRRKNEKRFHEHVSAVSELRAEVATLRQKLKSLHIEKANADGIIQALRDRNEAAREDLAARGTLLHKAEQRCAELAADCASAHAGQLVTKGKLEALREQHEAARSQNLVHERQLRLMKKDLDFSRAHATISSKIWEEMSKNGFSLPGPSKATTLLARVTGSSSAKWKQFGRALAEEGIFDPEGYLSLHADVAAAGVDPIMHFLTKGLVERRTFEKETGQ